MRIKEIKPTHGWILAAIDGHEIGSSYKRCAEGCLQRELTVGGESKTQYYNRLVAFQIIADGFNFLRHGGVHHRDHYRTIARRLVA